ncbi:MAG TPA: YwiC-like family protein [Blastocatellia bacterium]|nr:YwiC-like family protein [Blastocatellia bacterium]
MSKRSSLKIPREHGAWAMLYVPLVVGALVALSLSFRLLLLTLSVTLVFTARGALVALLRSRSRGRTDQHARRLTFAYLGLAALLGAPLVFLSRLYWLVPLSMATAILLTVNARKAVRGEDRTVAGEMVAIAGLTLTAPAAYYVSAGVLNATAIWLWMLCALYFASSVFYVKLRVNTLNVRKEEARRQSWKRCAVYHICLFVALVVLALTGNLSLFAVAAFMPVLVRSFWYLAKPVRQNNLQQVGWLEMIYSIVFLIFITLTFRV